jgi:hypothetical protein
LPCLIRARGATYRAGAGRTRISPPTAPNNPPIRSASTVVQGGTPVGEEEEDVEEEDIPGIDEPWLALIMLESIGLGFTKKRKLPLSWCPSTAETVRHTTT